MANLQTLQQLFKRYRKPGDIVFCDNFSGFLSFPTDSDHDGDGLGKANQMVRSTTPMADNSDSRYGDFCSPTLLRFTSITAH